MIDLRLPPHAGLRRALLSLMCMAGLIAARDAQAECISGANGKMLCRISATLSPEGRVVPNATWAITVWPNRATRLLGWVRVDGNDCSTQSGSWMVTAPPAHGTTATEIVTLAIPSGTCAGTPAPYNFMVYTWTDGAEGQTKDPFDATWMAGGDASSAEHFDITKAHVKVIDVDWITGHINAKLAAPSGATGVVEARFTGNPVNSPLFRSTGPEGSGQIALEFDRPEVRKAKYSKVTVTWKTNPVLEGKLTPGTPWNVLGNTRYSQYNVPHESACGTTTRTYWIVDSLTSCNFTPVTLRRNFAEQVHINGTGVSLSHGTLKAGAATSMAGGTCSHNFPPGSTLRQLFLPVADVTGSCNIPLVADSSLAVHKKLGLACNADVMLVNGSNANFGARIRHDTCPACNDGFNGTEGHIDHFTDTPACSGNAVGDLGNYWTVQTD